MRTLMSDIIASYAYTLNAKGQRTHVEERVGTQLVRTIDYTYDDADRLIEEQIDDVITGVRTITYTYDPVGNRLEKNDNGVITTYDYDDNDRLLTEGGYTYGYDNNGNLLSKTGNGEQYNFSYNALNQVVHADINTGTGSSSVDYVYDHDGIRVGKTINGTDVTTYIVDKNRPYAQVLEEQWTNGTLNATAGYVYGDALLSRTTNGTTHYYLYDGMGSVRGLTDSTGSLTDAYTYDAYGLLLDKTGSTINPYLYRGEQYDDDLSAYYLRARYYQPGIGRFLTTDPVEGFPNNPVTLHRYLYANCNPINKIDPSGEVSLPEVLSVLSITSFTASMTIGDMPTVQDALASWGESVFPDAGVLGASISVTGQSPAEIQDDMYAFFSFIEGGSSNLLPALPNTELSMGATFGIDIVFSLSSAQIGFYTYLGGQTDYGYTKVQSKNFSAQFTAYHGWIWNLWNVENYTGPFVGIAGSGGGFGVSVFCDAKNGFRGPYGIAFPFYSKGGNNYETSMGLSYAVWRENFSYIDRPDPREIAYYLVGVQYAIIGISALTNNTASLISSSISMSLTGWIAQSKIGRQRKNPEYSIDKRQDHENPTRPEKYQSGPGRWFF
jgi:RHS repeat-associated protein